MAKSTVRTYMKTLDKVFSKYIRLRDCLRTTGNRGFGRCVTCGEVKPFDELDAGHWMRRNIFSTKYDERNCHAQCTLCNKWRSGEQSKHEREMVKLYGEQEVEVVWYAANNVIKKFTLDELKALKKTFESKIAKLLGNSQ